MIQSMWHNPAWRDFRPETSPHRLTEPDDLPEIVAEMERLTGTLSADLLKPSPEVVSNLDRLLLLCLLASRLADRDTMRLSGGELAIVESLIVRIGGRLKRGASE